MFDTPRGICADTNGTLVVADSNNSCIRRINADGELRFRRSTPQTLFPSLTATTLARRD